jgi:hypothetical protein
LQFTADKFEKGFAFIANKLSKVLQIGCADIFASKSNRETEAKLFRFDAKKVLFRLFSHRYESRNLKQNRTKKKRKLPSFRSKRKEAKYFRFDAKTVKRKRIK